MSLRKHERLKVDVLWVARWWTLTRLALQARFERMRVHGPVGSKRITSAAPGETSPRQSLKMTLVGQENFGAVTNGPAVSAKL